MNERAEAGRQVVVQLVARMDAIVRINEELLKQNADLARSVHAQNALLQRQSTKLDELQLRLDVMAQAIMDGDEYVEASAIAQGQGVVQNTFRQLGQGILNGMLNGGRPGFQQPPQPPFQQGTGYPPPGAHRRAYTGQQPGWRQR